MQTLLVGGLAAGAAYGARARLRLSGSGLRLCRVLVDIFLLRIMQPDQRLDQTPDRALRIANEIAAASSPEAQEAMRLRSLA